MQSFLNQRVNIRLDRPFIHPRFEVGEGFRVLLMKMPQKSSPAIRKITRFIILTLGLGVIGIGFGLAGMLIGAKVLPSDSAGFAALGLAIGGLIVGYPIGIIVGIILIKKVLHQRGSLLLGIAGCIIGAAAAIGLAEPLNLNSNSDLLFITFLIVVPAFCMAGFYLKR